MKKGDYRITRARPEDVPTLAAIELAAAKLLEGYAPESVLAETTSEETFLVAQRLGHLWVALVNNEPIGFACVRILDPECVHLEELDVLPSHGRRGVGTGLVEMVCEWASARNYQCITLTTFRDVPWNMPFYAKLGFEAIPPRDLSGGLRATIEDEARRGLDPERRLAMRRSCSPAAVTMDREDVQIRAACYSDLEQLALMCEALWPTSSAKEHVQELRLILSGRSALVLTMPLVIFVAEAADGSLIGFVEVDLRSHADGCSPELPVGYIEGWYVIEAYRQRGVGKRLVAEAEDWVRQQGCLEIASDVIIDNKISQDAHRALGYEVVGRCVHFRKTL